MLSGEVIGELSEGYNAATGDKATHRNAQNTNLSPFVQWRLTTWAIYASSGDRE
jgi:hypothetical protein